MPRFANELSLSDAAAKIVAGRTLRDGLTVTATTGEIERSVPIREVLLVEKHCETSDWKIRFGTWTESDSGREFSESIPHYELFVARNGVEDLLDANGDCYAQVARKAGI